MFKNHEHLSAPFKDWNLGPLKYWVRAPTGRAQRDSKSPFAETSALETFSCIRNVPFKTCPFTGQFPRGGSSVGKDIGLSERRAPYRTFEVFHCLLFNHHSLRERNVARFGGIILTELYTRQRVSESTGVLQPTATSTKTVETSQVAPAMTIS